MSKWPHTMYQPQHGAGEAALCSSTGVKALVQLHPRPGHHFLNSAWASTPSWC